MVFNSVLSIFFIKYSESFYFFQAYLINHKRKSKFNLRKSLAKVIFMGVGNKFKQ